MHVIHVRKIKDVYQMLVAEVEVTGHLEAFALRGGIILKWISMKQSVVVFSVLQRRCSL
jgi:hypothetical protein